MNKNIDEIMDMLDWNNDIEVQRQGIELGKAVKNFNVFFQPVNGKYNKSVWDNCAEIICSKTVEELEAYVFELFRWVQDINWPGSLQIVEKIKELKENIYISHCLDKYINIAKKIGDDIWLENLLEIKNS